MVRNDSPPLSTATWKATRRLALEAATAQVVGSLSDRGVRAIVLKGPALAGWLYDGPHQRPYGDVDLLVAPQTFDLAEVCLDQLGFRYPLAGARPNEQATHAHEWVRKRPLRAAVDLHRSLYWIRIPEAAAWEILSRDTDVIEIGGASVEVLARPARALVVALHAAQHGRDSRKPLRDLERALAVGHDGLWREAADLATQLDVRRPFTAGLRLHPAGIELAARLGLGARMSREVLLLTVSPPPTAIGFHRLAEAESWREKLRVTVEKLFPSPPLLRAWQPVAQRGAAGLALAYAWRPLWLFWKAPRGLIALVRAARSERS
jgi:hypothetical protein